MINLRSINIVITPLLFNLLAYGCIKPGTDNLINMQKDCFSIYLMLRKFN